MIDQGLDAECMTHDLQSGKKKSVWINSAKVLDKCLIFKCLTN